MPDISLLQQEYYGAQEEESKTPGLISAAAVIVLVIVIGGYAALYVYNQMLVKEAGEISENIANMKVGEVTETVGELKKLGTQAMILKELREAHAEPTKLFLALERSTHPLVSFSDGNIDVTKGGVILKGIAPSTAVLARQVEIYASDEAIDSFSIENIGYADKPATEFQLIMNIKK